MNSPRPPTTRTGRRLRRISDSSGRSIFSSRTSGLGVPESVFVLILSRSITAPRGSMQRQKAPAARCGRRSTLQAEDTCREFEDDRGIGQRAEEAVKSVRVVADLGGKHL